MMLVDLLGLAEGLHSSGSKKEDSRMIFSCIAKWPGAVAPS